jgi:F-type H+-transporting ATPase subunit gamma
MANLKIIRTRIESVASTKQITSAMKMVSAAKLRKAQDAIINLRPYSDKLQQILESVVDSIKEDEDYVYLKRREEINKVLLLVITSNRGLCGAFNSNVIKQAISLAIRKYGPQLDKNNVEFFAIGKKGYEYLRRKNLNVTRPERDPFETLTYINVAEIAVRIMEKFSGGEYDQVEIVYNQFKNAAVQILSVEPFLPVEFKINRTEETGILKTYTDYIFEPSKEYIKKDLIPKALKLQLFKSLIDSFASEQGARMTAMHKATDNATELIRQLKLDYNKARQANITNEILEIVSGANALKG